MGRRTRETAGQRGMVLGTLRDVVVVLRANLATFVAGSLAYTAFMSIVPLLTLALVAATVLGDHQAVERALALTEAYLPPTVSDLSEEAVGTSRGRVGVSVISLVLLVWSGLRVFRGLSASFAMFYDATDDAGPLSSLRDGLLVLVALAVALVASVTVGAFATAGRLVPMDGALGPLLLVGPLIVAFIPIYYVFPAVDVSVRDVLPGVFVAAFGWAILEAVFQAYVAGAGRFEVYGTLGAVLLVLTWLYLASLLLLVGIAVNVVLDDRTTAALDDTPQPRDHSPSD